MGRVDRSSQDPAFPALHGRPARGWVNDPNGVCHVDGRYHVFFQFNPVAPVHSRIVWGHASSQDLCTWRQEPTALHPREGHLDSYGCWTGCVVVDDGTPTAVYSAVSDGSGRSHVLLARGDHTLKGWQQDAEAVVGMPDGAPWAQGLSDVRDPFVVRLAGRRYAIQGAGRRGGGEPRILLYDAQDLRRWHLVGTLLDATSPEVRALAAADIWECPNLFRLGEHWVLVVSLWRDAPSPGGGPHGLHGVRYLVGTIEVPEGECTPVFCPYIGLGGRLDDGPLFYAPQILVTGGGRVLAWAWAWELGRSPQQVAEAGWAGCLTFARELSLSDGVLACRPVPELAALRGPGRALRSGDPLGGPGAWDVDLPAGAGEASLVLRTPEGDVVVSAWSVPDQPLQPPRVLIDGSMVEIFPGGPRPLTTRAYPSGRSVWVLSWSSQGVATAHGLAPRYDS